MSAIERPVVGGLDGLDTPVRTTFERISGPAAAATPDLAAIGAALVDLAADLDYVGRWVERIGDESRSLPIHAPERGPRLMIVHRAEGQMGAVHDHYVGRDRPDRRSRDAPSLPGRPRRRERRPRPDGSRWPRTSARADARGHAPVAG